jgi:LacI family transcriptional regulator
LGTRERKLATLRDVARHAGVSHTTVSRVINGEAVVASRTRENVERAIKALDFVPNPAARTLSGMEYVRVALLHQFPNPGSLGEFLIHLIDHVTRAHATLSIHEVAGTADRDAILQTLDAQRVRGAILAPPLADDQALVDGLLALGIAVVATGSTRHGTPLASVSVNDRAAARAMTEHLLAMGHRRIAFVSGDPRYASADQRLRGYKDALAGAGLPFQEDLVASGLYTYQSGLAAAEQLLRRVDRPTAIFASNDDMAAAAVAVAHRHHIDVPAEVAICGFDDSPLATTIWPSLTTIRRPTAEITGLALQMILDQLARGSGETLPAQHVDVEHTLVRRESDGPPPA